MKMLVHPLAARRIPMKRLLAFAALFLLCTGPVTADYLFIKIDINKLNFNAAAEQPKGGQPAGGAPGVGGLGAGGPGFGGQPGGQDAASAVEPVYIYAFLELKAPYKPVPLPAGAPKVIEADHRFGKKGRFPDFPDVVKYETIYGVS